MGEVAEHVGFLHPLEPAIFKKTQGYKSGGELATGGLISKEVNGKRVRRELRGDLDME